MGEREKIIRNSAYCKICDEHIESTHRHDFVCCRGQHVCVDGGKEYLRRVGSDIFNSDVCEDTSITEGGDA
jgi:hypothetical protein